MGKCSEKSRGYNQPPVNWKEGEWKANGFVPNVVGLMVKMAARKMNMMTYAWASLNAKDLLRYRTNHILMKNYNQIWGLASEGRRVSLISLRAPPQLTPDRTDVIGLPPRSVSLAGRTQKGFEDEQRN